MASQTIAATMAMASSPVTAGPNGAEVEATGPGVPPPFPPLPVDGGVPVPFPGAEPFDATTTLVVALDRVPSASWTWQATVNVPDWANEWVTFLPAAVLPSPKFQL
jgi:hypothetical protein